MPYITIPTGLPYFLHARSSFNANTPIKMTLDATVLSVPNSTWQIYHCRLVLVSPETYPTFTYIQNFYMYCLQLPFSFSTFHSSIAVVSNLLIWYQARSTRVTLQLFQNALVLVAFFLKHFKRIMATVTKVDGWV